MRIRLAAILLIMGLLLACNFPLYAAATETPVGIPVTGATGTAGPFSTFTPVPINSATATVGPTPTTPQVTPVSANVNCRSGPDIAYDAVSILMLGSVAQVSGRNDDSSWWYIHDPSNPGGFCWVSSDVVSFAGPKGGITVVAPPKAIVTKVTVDVNLPSTVFCGGPNAVMFSGTITTNGAAKVKLEWEVGGDRSNTTPAQTLDFSAAGTQDAPNPGSLSLDCGHYTITLHVLEPNDISAKKNFDISG